MSEHQKPSVSPKAVRQIIIALLLVCAGWVLIELEPIKELLGFTDTKHGHADSEVIPGFHTPGFHAAYGFISCVLLVLAATQMRRFVKRDEDYYDD